MRVFAASTMALGLFAMPAMAAGGAANNTSAASAEPTTAAAKPAPQPAKSAAASNAASPAKPAEAMETELQQLRDAVALQAQQIQDQQKKMRQLENQLKASGAVRENLSVSPTASAAEMPSATAAPVSTASLSSTGANTAPPATAADNNNQGGSDEPSSWHLKGITLTPGGFFAAETVWRQHALSADVNTAFNSIPVPGSSENHITEFNASARQSRISMLAQGKLDNVKVTGYYETDFLSAGLTSNDNESNSYTLRQRQFWAQAAFNNGWTVTGGQMWSLATETADGVSNRTEAAPLTIDAQYTAGFSWARQYGVRFSKDFDNKMWLAMSVENPQTTFGAHGQNSNFVLGTSGNGGGLLNSTANYSFNAAPDFIFKAVFQPGFGHYEVFGILSTFRDRVFPTAATPYNDKQVGGGIGANARFQLDDKHVVLGAHFLTGEGVGRYGTSGLPDATVRPDGTLALIRSYQGLGTLEFHYPKIDVYFNAGGEFDGRTSFVNGAGTVPNEGYGAVGFNNSGCWTEPAPGGSNGYSLGSVANCTADTRNVMEGTAGFWYRFYKGTKGTVQVGGQYSYLQRNTWSGASADPNHPSGQPQGTENMFFTSFRYYIP
ncbi:MAG: hypothetical protein ACRD4R_17030 [Candidatus Acidiferrales bacterium]